MLVFGTQIHIVTFIFIVLETVMFLFQFMYYLFRPEDKSRLWYLILLFLLLLYNVTGGLFPDPKINLPIDLQNMVAYGTGFLMASYFPYYFYRAFDLKILRWHAVYGVPLFLMLPYLIFFVIVYAITGDLKVDIHYGVIAPFIYSLVLLWVIFKAIWAKYRENSNHQYYMEEIAVYCAVTPWASMTVFSWFQVGQLTEVLCTNTGFIIITIVFISNSIKATRMEYRQFIEMSVGTGAENFEANCRNYKLTKREIEVFLLIKMGLRYKEIGERLFISERTVNKHVQNIFEKTGVSGKIQLLQKLGLEEK